MQETDAGQPTADFVFSSAMDLQVKLANDGYARSADGGAWPRAWPDWANWRDTAFALTFEPAVLVYHKPSFPDGPPQSRLELMDWLETRAARAASAPMTSNGRRSAICSWCATRNISPIIWSLLRGDGAGGLQTFPTSQDDHRPRGRRAAGAGLQHPWLLCRRSGPAEPDLGLVLPRISSWSSPRGAGAARGGVARPGRARSWPF